MRAIWALTLTELRRFRGPLPMLSAVFLVCVPLLYGAIYLWSNWDPYGHLGDLKVAVVNLDKPVTVDRRRIAGGADLVEQLSSDDSFDWTTTTAADAAAGVADGTYVFSLTVPADFSRRLTSIARGAPQRAQVIVRLDNAQGYIPGIIAQTAEKELQTQLNAAAVKSYAEASLGSVKTLRAGLETVSDGADQLADGSRRVANGVAVLDAKVKPIVGTGTKVLQDSSGEALEVSRQVAGTASTIADASASAKQRHDTLASRIDDLLVANPELASDPAYARLQKASKELGTVASSVAETTQRVADDAQTVEGVVAKVDKDVPKLVAAGDTAVAQVDALSDGADRVAAGNARLAAGLAKIEAAVPALSKKQRADDADAVSNPVRIRSQVMNPAKYYGRGLAPFFFAVSLWVFGLVAFVLMRPVSPRALMSGASPFVAAVGGWLPVAMLGAAGGVLLLAATDILLGLDPVNLATTAALTVLGVIAYAALAQLLRVVFGLVGGAIMLVLLIVQLGAAGGLYPVTTMPGFFQVLHPYMPMTYLVEALRVSISGGSASQMYLGFAVGGGLLVVSLALTAVASWRQRTYSAVRLHPKLGD